MEFFNKEMEGNFYRIVSKNGNEFSNHIPVYFLLIVIRTLYIRSYHVIFRFQHRNFISLFL